MRTCTKCHTTKPLTEFHHSSKHKNGYKPHCKACCSEYGKHYYRDLKPCRVQKPKKDIEVLIGLKIPQLKALQVPAELAKKILTLPYMDRYSINKLAEKCCCSKDEVKSVLLNERKWLES